MFSKELLKESRTWALDIAEKRRPWIRSLHRMDRIGSLSEAREILKVAREQAKKTAPNMPQHQACLDVIEHGIVHGGYSGLLKVLLVLIYCHGILCVNDSFSESIASLLFLFFLLESRRVIISNMQVSFYSKG